MKEESKECPAIMKEGKKEETFPGIKIYYKPTVTNIIQYWQKDKQIDRINRPAYINNLTYNRITVDQWIKNDLFNKQS